MPTVDGSLGAMLQGVNQQPSRIRPVGHVTEQINYESDVQEGITSRPGTDEIAKLTGSTSTMAILDFSWQGTKYQAGFGLGEFKVWDDAGAALTLSSPDGLGYIGEDMLFYTDEDEKVVFCLNRDKVVEADATVVGRPFDAGLITCLGGQFSRTYEVTISSGVTSITASYTTPDGTGSGDADNTSSDAIIEEIRLALVAEGLPTGMTLERASDVLVVNYTAPMTIAVSDGEYGAVLRAATETVDKVEDLPRFAKHGHVVRVVGDVSGDDDYYLRFNSDTTDVDGDGFGDTGVWEETADPSLAHNLDLDTMPMELTISGSSATLSRGSWLGRRIGDEDSNPIPSFVGKSIRDLGGFESRLAVLAGGKVIMSRSDDPRDFFKKSATVDSDSDPVEVKSMKSSGASLDWMIPFDRNLLLVSDPGSAQFVITGGGLTPSNASMVLTTDYTVNTGARPVTTGRTVMLPFLSGVHSGINEFFTNDQVATNGADPLTSAQDKYIQGTVSSMAVAENFNLVAFTASGDTDTLYVYKYLWNASDRVQSSWSKRQFPGPVRNVFFDSSNMFVTIDNVDNPGEAILLRMDLNRTDDDVGFHITLDRKTVHTVDADNEITVDYEDAIVVQRTGCATPGNYAVPETITDNGDGTFTHEFRASTCPEGSTVTVGLPVYRELQPTQPEYRDREGRVVSNVVLTIAAYMITLARSADVKVTFDSAYRANREFWPRRFPLDDDHLDPDRYGFKNHTLRVPWRERNDRASMTITSEDIRPDTILEIEWDGSFRKLRRRLG